MWPALVNHICYPYVVCLLALSITITPAWSQHVTSKNFVLYHVIIVLPTTNKIRGLQKKGSFRTSKTGKKGFTHRHYSVVRHRITAGPQTFKKLDNAAIIQSC